ncbi:VOC family protein [Pusillimonas sp.]|uniref:VOC family protein n=1 Tax=Pusillimonas sp. TaxID=3040095 RepID=UPI0029A05B81|nr:VOC family protein [Pusillimonas sp.]MDX3895545.1 VOC family protein [Pusillimonas sp.]
MTPDICSPPYKALNPFIRPTRLVCGTLVTRSVGKARRFYEDMLGLECALIEPGRMLVRTNADARAQAHVSRDWMLDVRQKAEIANPQRVLHHWGIDLVSEEAVDRMHERLLANKSSYEIGKIFTPNTQHGSYGFYFSDFDSNWWEFQYVPPQYQHREMLIRGDVA